MYPGYTIGQAKLPADDPCVGIYPSYRHQTGGFTKPASGAICIQQEAKEKQFST
jgi:hypothetical protein